MDLEAHLDDEHLVVLNMLPEHLLDLSNLEASRAAIDEMAVAVPFEPDPATLLVEDHYVNGFDGHQVLVRTYTPQPARPNSPALYWMHPGGMVLGDVGLSDISCGQIAEQLNVVVASVEYRLAPEAPYPIPMEDCYSGFEWFFGAADQLGIDTSKIAIGGSSAGGGLAAGLALLLRDREHAAPCYQLLTFPMLDDRNETPSSYMITDTRVWNRDANLLAWDGYLDGEAGSDDVPGYAAPSRATDLTGLPPALITVGSFDMFRDEDIAYAMGLLQAGVPTELHVYPGAFHGSQGFVPDAAVSQQWVRDEFAALDKALNG